MAVAGAFDPDVPVVAEQCGHAEGRAWLATLPGLVASLEDDWGLVTGAPYRGGSASWVAPATRRDGTPAVIKVNLPHREARWEAAAFEIWEGGGAVELYRRDDARWALLVEQCDPGVTLGRANLPIEEALGAAAAILNRLWQGDLERCASFELLGDVTAEWAGGVRERMHRHRPPFDPGLVETGARLLETLPGSAGRRVVLHGDFNPGNILSSERGWLAIDAKPMLGDPGYDPAPLLEQIEEHVEGAGTPARALLRYDLFADLVGEPRDRLLAWSAARAVEAALWCVDRGDPAAGAACMAAAQGLVELAGA
jgi:streptomycin 6-kinase